MNKIVYIIFFLFLSSFSLFGQNERDSLSLKITTKWSGKILNLNSSYISKQKDTIKITQLKFYISDFQVKYDDNTILSDKNKKHIVNGFILSFFQFGRSILFLIWKV